MGDALKRRLVASLLLVAFLGCAAPSRWQTTRRPDELDAAELLASDSLGLSRDERPDEMPNVPVRSRLRPCCAFGSALGVRVGLLAIPGLAIGNIRSPDAIGNHRYDAGRLADDVTAGSERNGLVYTCRGGFIDIAHVRDYADWTLFLATRLGRILETGGTIELPPGEGGQRRLVLEPIDPEFVGIVGRRDLTAALAVWVGFQLSIWHEVATWYGWSSFNAFSERASAFSPEDLYSNLLGAKIAGPIISGGNDLSEAIFDRAVDAWIEQSLDFLGGVPAKLGEDAMAAVDQLWWNSRARLPDANLVLRRNVQHGIRIVPWLVPLERFDSKARQRITSRCQGEPEPHLLRNPTRIPGLEFEAVLRLEVELGPDFQDMESLAAYGDIVTNRDFPELLERIRQEIREEFGASADRPD